MTTPIYTKEEALEFVTPNGMNLKYLNTLFRDDPDIVLTAIKQDGRSLQYASERLRCDQDIVVQAITQRGDALLYVESEFKKNKDIVLLAVMKNGRSLEYVSNELKEDREVVLAAVSQHGLALEYASRVLKEDKEVAITAMLQNVGAFWSLDFIIQKDPVCVFILDHWSHILNNQKDLVKEALLERQEYFLNPEPYMQALIDGMEYPYLMLAQYALSKDVIIEPEPYPEGII